MVTDHLLIRRVAAELDRALAGRRVSDSGIDERYGVTLLFGGGQDTAALHLQPFSTPPLVWLGPPAGLALEGEPGWLRTGGAILRGLRLGAVKARRGDRVLSFGFGGRSRFGVTSETQLIAELVPRFGNLIVLRGGTIVAAEKTFSPSENQARSVEIGRAYDAPPLPEPKIDRAGFIAQIARGPDVWQHALRDYLPMLPRLIASSLVIEARDLALDAEALAAWFEARASALDVLGVEGPVHVYHRGDEIVQAHIVPLAQYAALGHRITDSLLDVFATIATVGAHARRADDVERRRAALLRTLQQRDEALRAQLARLGERERELANRDALRRAGEDIYARLFELEPHAQADAKAEATRYFERYRKATAALPHIARRRTALERARNDLEALIWEAERADAHVLGEIASDLDGRATRSQPRRSKTAPLELRSGSRIYVGRSPRENAALTFEVARPNDLWFHARNTPGAHVILAPVDRKEPSEDDIATAAALAAYHSRARNSASVDVDYTRRKHVRKQRNASPGMVWYTDFTTIRVAPRAP
ncbi:MAG: DUF814 domain-containing protein [Candidatus Eremiobacteraeota bacterium]|nr:DUF814 domain-containing protein [Candidatus Eremiobacteraeota bacterium]